jgi:RimJ/RimL family protein N-acetyltransferase
VPEPQSPAQSAAALDHAVDAALRRFPSLDEASSQLPLRAGGWCARETLGHLIDSACNNQRRFVVGQPPGVARFDGYTQDEWVARQRYRDEPWANLVALWTAYNRHLAHVMRATSNEAAAGSALSPDGSQTITVGFLMEDYVAHLTHHVAQIAAFADTHRDNRPVGAPVDGADARIPARRTLTGVRHDFLPVDADAHAADLFDATNTRDADGVWTYLWYGPFATRDQMREWMRGCAESIDPLFFAVVERASGRAVGMCALMRVAPDMRTIELGHIWYVPAVQGSGVNADMSLTLLTACFEQWGYRRAEWKCDSLNGRSRSAALKLGFTFEGVFRQHMVRKGHNRDTAWFSLLDSEWPAAKGALERRLAR